MAFVGTNAVRNSKGIYLVIIDGETYRPELVDTHWAYNAGAMTISRECDVLYAATEGNTFHGYADGGIHGFYDQLMRALPEEKCDGPIY